MRQLSRLAPSHQPFARFTSQRSQRLIAVLCPESGSNCPPSLLMMVEPLTPVTMNP